MTHPDKYKGIASLLPKKLVDTYSYFNQIITKQTQNLLKGNPAASASKSAKATKQKSELRKWAIDYFISHPYAEYDEVAEFLVSYSVSHGHKMANGNPYKFSTIKSAIGKTRDEARNIITSNAKK